MPRKKKQIPLYERKEKLVEVFWIDAQAEENWEYLEGLDKTAMYIKTVGYQLDLLSVEVYLLIKG